jgi:hypothetical protein
MFNNVKHAVKILFSKEKIREVNFQLKANYTQTPTVPANK